MSALVKCKNCGYFGEYTGKSCPACSEIITYTDKEAADAVNLARELVKKHEYVDAAKLYEMLVDMDVHEAKRDFAEILERGNFVPRDFDRAMNLFLSCAERYDAEAAYRYSRLAARVSDEASHFWLRYSAVLGCKEAYGDVARLFSEEGYEELATYYFRLSADAGNKDSLAELAERYYRGIGAPACEEYAKWFLDKFFMPPIYLIKIAYKLRSVKAEEPPVPEVGNYDGYLRALSELAEKYKIYTAYFYISKLLSERGDAAATLAFGACLVEGVGCDKNVTEGLSVLERLAADGYADAYGYLGSIYSEGELVTEDKELAARYFLLAGEHGSADAYEILGDMYKAGDGVERNPARAIELYELSAKGGSRAGALKEEEMKRKRADFFERGVALLETTPNDAFRAFAISAAMGYLPSEHKLGFCYENGVGTDIDRYAAFYWYDSAVRGGEEAAIFDLARCYAYGIGVAFDYKKAVKLFMTSGADKELVRGEISRLLDAKRRRMIGALFSRAMRLLYQKKIEPAFEILEGLERLGHPQGVYTLGCLLEFGFGAKTDRDRAYSLYEKAYKLKFRDPRQSYKLIVLKMVR